MGNQFWHEDSRCNECDGLEKDLDKAQARIAELEKALEIVLKFRIDYRRIEELLNVEVNDD